MNEFDPTDKSNWLWTAMICLPDAVTSAMIDDVLPAVTASKELRAGSKVRVEAFREGVAAQILHVGSHADEAPKIAALHEFIHDNGHRLAGKRHEIYLSDPRKTDVAKLRTNIRQPFADD